jgi:hypothetical protein
MHMSKDMNSTRYIICTKEEKHLKQGNQLLITILRLLYIARQSNKHCSFLELTDNTLLTSMELYGTAFILTERSATVMCIVHLQTSGSKRGGLSDSARFIMRLIAST